MKKQKIISVTKWAVLEECRLIENHEEVLDIVNEARTLGLKIIYTMGAYDMFHVGHARYVRKAKEKGDLLIVGVDSDEYIKATKGEDRPVVPYVERSEMLIENRSADIVVMLQTQDANMQLVEMIRPDAVVLSFSSTKEDVSIYQKRMNEKYGKYCGDVIIFERQAETSTSAKIRLIVIDGAKTLLDKIQKTIDELTEAYKSFFKKNGGES